MSGKINYQESIEKKRIIYDRSIWSTIGEFLEYLPIAFPFFFMGAVTLCKGIMNGTLTMQEAIWSILGILSGLFVLYRIRKTGRLAVLKGIDAKTNRQLVNEMAKRSGWESRYNNSKFAVFTLPESWLSFDWGREMTIIYNGNEILFNCTCFATGKLPSPFHWIPTKKIEQEFIQEFISMQKSGYLITST